MKHKPDIGLAMLQFLANTRPRTTNPAIESISITSDGFAIARLSGSRARQSESGAFLGAVALLLEHARRCQQQHYKRWGGLNMDEALATRSDADWR